MIHACKLEAFHSGSCPECGVFYTASAIHVGGYVSASKVKKAIATTEELLSVRKPPMPTKIGENDLLFFDFVLTTEGRNANGQIFMDNELEIEDVHKSPIGQAIDRDHKQDIDSICGDIYDSAFIPREKSSIIDEVTKKPLSNIVCYACIFKVYQDLCFKVIRGTTPPNEYIKMSMECRPRHTETVSDGIVLHLPRFSGAGIVRFPANKNSTLTVNTSEEKEKKDPVIPHQPDFHLEPTRPIVWSIKKKVSVLPSEKEAVFLRRYEDARN